MTKEIKYSIFIILIIIFIFFTGKYYFSDNHKKKSYRSLTNIEKRIILFSQNIPVLENDTQNIIEYKKNTKTTIKKRYHFWDLIDKK